MCVCVAPDTSFCRSWELYSTSVINNVMKGQTVKENAVDIILLFRRPQGGQSQLHPDLGNSTPASCYLQLCSWPHQGQITLDCHRLPNLITVLQTYGLYFRLSLSTTQRSMHRSRTVSRCLIGWTRSSRTGTFARRLGTRVFHKNTFSKVTIAHTLTTPYRAYINHIQKIFFLGQV